jgi:hypothetical protein
MWGGMFSPDLKKSGGCEHGAIYVQVGQPEMGLAPIYVQFNHRCTGRGGIKTSPPSNAITYTFEVELDSFMEAEQEEAADLQQELDNMSDSEKLKWVNDNLVSTSI